MRLFFGLFVIFIAGVTSFGNIPFIGILLLSLFLSALVYAVSGEMAAMPIGTTVTFLLIAFAIDGLSDDR